MVAFGRYRAMATQRLKLDEYEERVNVIHKNLEPYNYSVKSYVNVLHVAATLLQEP